MRLAQEEREERAAAASREALVTHLATWYESQVAILQRRNDLSELLQKTNATGRIWRMLNWEHRNELKPVTLWHLGILNAALHQNGVPGQKDDDRIRRLAKAIDLHMDLLEEWENSPDDRAKTGLRMVAEREKFRVANGTPAEAKEGKVQLEQLRERLSVIEHR